MADGAAVRAGTAGGTINVVTDEITSPYSGSSEHAQALKIIDGTPNGTAAVTVTSNHEVLTFQANSGTVSVTGTPNVHVTNSGTVVQGTDPWRTHQTNNGTVSVSAITGTVPTLEQG